MKARHCRRDPLDWSLRACEYDALRDKRTDEFRTSCLIESRYLEVIEEAKNYKDVKKGQS